MTINDRIGKYLLSGRAWYNRNVNTIKVITVHHDAIPHGNRSADEVMASIMNIHTVQKGWPGAAYHYYIHSGGGIYQMNKHEWVTWHDTRNYDSLAIVLNGYFHSPHNNKPTEAQLKSLKWLLDKLSTQHPEFPADQNDVMGHRDRSATACPGDLLYPYVKEYRDKLGNVDWGQVVTPPPEPSPIDDQTIIPIGGDWGNMEVQKIRSTLNDLLRDKITAEAEADRLKTQHEQLVKEAVDSAIRQRDLQWQKIVQDRLTDLGNKKDEYWKKQVELEKMKKIEEYSSSELFGFAFKKLFS